MSRAVITKSILTAIANAIRAKAGTQAQMTPSQMAAAITDLPAGAPDFLYQANSQNYPDSYTWPYAYMRDYQLARTAPVGGNDDFFVNFDFGSVVTVPDYAMTAFISGTAIQSSDKLRSVSGASVTRIGAHAFKCSALTSASFPLCDVIDEYAFAYSGLTAANFPALTHVSGSNVFAGCANLASISMPSLTSLGGNMFSNCTSLGAVSLSGLTALAQSAFSGSGITSLVLSGTYTSALNFLCQNCTHLTRADLDSQSLATIAANSFKGCTALTALIIRRTDAVVALANTNALQSSAIANGTGYVYVPDDLVNTYKTETNWITYAAQIKGLSELPSA